MLGSETFTTVAPSRSNSSHVSLHATRTSSLISATSYSIGTPTRQPARGIPTLLRRNEGGLWSAPDKSPVEPRKCFDTSSFVSSHRSSLFVLTSTLVESNGSAPWQVYIATAASLTLRARNPGVSIDDT